MWSSSARRRLEPTQRALLHTHTHPCESRCDGFLNYDRTSKFSDEDTAAIRKANQAIIAASRARGVEGGAGTAA